MARALPAGVVIDATGLPRPSPQAIRQRERDRRFLLRQTTGLDVDSLPAGLQQLVLRKRQPPSWETRGRPGHPLDADERQQLVNALVMRRLDARGVALVLNLVDDGPLSKEGLKAIVDEALAERERVERPGENFSIVSVERRETRKGVRFVMRAREDTGRAFSVLLAPHELVAVAGFRHACIEQATFRPILKPAYDGKRFEYFVAELLGKVKQ